MENKEEMGITLGDLFRVVKKNIILIAIVTILVAMLGAFYTFKVVTPKYQSSASFSVAVLSDPTDTEDVSIDMVYSLRAVVSVADHIKEDVILAPVAEANGISVDSLKGMVSYVNTENSIKITVSVTSTNPELCQKLADDIVQSVIDAASPEGILSFAANSVKLTSSARLGSYKSPNKMMYLIVSVLAGGVLACVIVFIKEFMSNKFKTNEEIESVLDETVIGIFFDEKKNKDEGVKLVEPSIRSLEGYNKLLSNIKYLKLEDPYKVIMTTSTIPNELKTTISSNLAYCALNNQKKVCIIDLDIRKPVIHKVFNVVKETGLVEYISGEATKEEIIKKSESGVDVITVGANVINPLVVIESLKLKELIKELKEEYDYVIIDTPPVIACSDAIAISKLADGVVYNIAINQAKKKDVKDSIKLLNNVNANIIGVNITKAETSKKGKGNYYYNYYYYGN